MKKLAMLAVLMLTGCSSMTGSPTPTTGWLFQIGSPSVVHVPVINTQTVGGTTTTGVGSHQYGPGMSPQVPPPAVVPVPSPGPLQMPRTTIKGECME